MLLPLRSAWIIHYKIVSGAEQGIEQGDKPSLSFKRGHFEILAVGTALGLRVDVG